MEGKAQVSETSIEMSGKVFVVRGDGQQTALQGRFLKESGFTLGNHGGAPALTSQEDWQKAIAAIWEERVPGWWNYQQELLDLGLCTHAEFSQALVSSLCHG